MSSYNLRNIRTLLTEGFTDTELRRFCYDTPEFRPVYDQLGETTGKAEIIHRLLEHADRKELLAPLLAWAKTQTPAKYEKYQPYQAGPTGVGHGKLHNVPELPPHFLPRPADLAEVKAALLGADQPIAITGATRKVGLQGMGGIGKSVLAAALARDDEVRQAFPDGIFWLTLGQEPSLTTRQSQLAEALGDPIRIFGDVQQGHAGLSELLAERTCLLILDDVWDVTHAEAFNALGPESCLLLTSRDAGVIRAFGAAEHRLDVLAKPQALELLAQWANQPVAGLPPEAKVVAKECGYLPLALAMIGAQVRDKPDRWGNVLHKLHQADLVKIRQQFPRYPYPNLLRALQVSVEVLESEAQAYYFELAVFPEDTPIPEVALQTYWASEGLDEYDVQDLLDMWVDRSLARRDDQGRLSLHDLQYDYVRKQTGDLTGLHQRLVDAYRQKCSNGWTDGPDDGYFFEHLAYHLVEAGQREELYALISKEWMDAQFKRTLSHRAFADDVERAIAVAGAEEPLNWVQVIRSCLIYATLCTLATSIPPETLGVLAQMRQVERALGYASLMQDLGKRSASYRFIAEALLAQGDVAAAKEILDQAVQVAESIEHERWKAEALSGVAQALARAGEKERAVQVAEAIEHEGWKAKTLSGVAQALARAGEKERAVVIANQVVQVTEAIEHEALKAVALSGVAQALAQAGEKDQAVQVAESIEDEGRKVEALSGVAQALAQAGEKDQAVQVAESIEHEWEKAEALSGVAQALAQAGEKERAVQVAEAIKHEGWKAEALSEVAQVLAQAGEKERAVVIANQALQVAEAIEDEWEKAEALSEVAQALAQAGEKERAVVIANQALQVAETIEDEWEKADALSEVAQALAQAGEKERAVQVAEAIEHEGRKVEALSEVAQALAQAGEKDQAVQVTEAIEHEGRKAEALSEVAQALAQAGEKERALVIANQAVQVAEAIEEELRKAEALSEVAQALAQAGEKDRALVIANQAVQVAEAIEDEVLKAVALSGVAQALARAGEKERAVQVAEAIEHEGWKAKALSGVAQALAQAGEKDRALVIANQTVQVAEAIEDEVLKAVALSGVAQALAQAGGSMPVQQIWRDVFATARLAGRKRIFETLQDSTMALVALDQGETLWQVYQAVMEVEGWWGTERMKAEG